jgi:addiction module RelB/DinJ family antitoxin
MANTALVQAKIEPELKISAEKYLNDFGLDISTAIRIFLKKVVQEEGIPFRIGRKRESFIPNENFAKYLDEVKDDIKHDIDILRFSDNKEAFDYLERLSK